MSSHKYGQSIGSEGQSSCNIQNSKRLSNEYRLKATQLPKPEQCLALARHIEVKYSKVYKSYLCKLQDYQYDSCWKIMYAVISVHMCMLKKR